MTVFAVEYTYDPAAAAVRDDHRPAHRAWLGELLDQGTLLASGPYVDGTGALLLFSTSDEAALRALLDADPFSVVGAVAGTRVVEWNPVMGPFAG